jgi:drug/metabolite transporter (DMT)-like permease
MVRGAWHDASPYLLLTLSTLFWAGNAVVARALHELLPPVTMAFWRWTLAALLLLPFVMRPMYQQRGLLRRYWGRMVLFSVLGITGFNIFLYTALQTTTATNSVIINAITPLLIVFFNWLLFAVRMSWKQQAGIVLSLAGVIAIVSRGDAAALADLDFNHGDFYVLGSACCWALYTAGLRWRPEGISPRAFLGATIVIGAVLLLPLYLAEMASGRAASFGLPSLAGLVYFAVFPSILAYLFWNRGVHEVGANRAGLFIYAVPVFGAALSMLFLGETLMRFHAIGAALIFSGVYISTAAGPGAGGN